MSNLAKKTKTTVIPCLHETRTMANHRLLQGIAVIDLAKSFDELKRSAYSKKYVDQEESVCVRKITERTSYAKNHSTFMVR